MEKANEQRLQEGATSTSLHNFQRLIPKLPKQILTALLNLSNHAF